MTFPRINGRTVNGDARTLPQDFSGRYNVVLVAFTQAQQYDVDSWLPFLDGLRADHPHINVYEVPVVRRYPFYQRWLLDSWMYNGIPDADVRDRTITLYTDVPAFLHALDLPDTRAISVLLVDSAGRVYWQATGAYDAAKGGSLRTALAAAPV